MSLEKGDIDYPSNHSSQPSSNCNPVKYYLVSLHTGQYFPSRAISLSGQENHSSQVLHHPLCNIPPVLFTHYDRINILRKQWLSSKVLRSTGLLWILWVDRLWRGFITHTYDAWARKILARTEKARGFDWHVLPFGIHPYASLGFLPRIKSCDQFCCQTLLITSEITKPPVSSKDGNTNFTFGMKIKPCVVLLKLSQGWQTRFAFQYYYKPCPISPCKIIL